VADARTRRIEVDAALARKSFHAAILRQVRLFRVLNIVVGGEDRLRGIVHLAGADGFELLHHRGGIVVSHDMVGTDGEEVSRAQGAIRSLGHVRLGNLFHDGLCHQ
jgi:hypothetical protein